MTTILLNLPILLITGKLQGSDTLNNTDQNFSWRGEPLDSGTGWLEELTIHISWPTIKLQGDNGPQYEAAFKWWATDYNKVKVFQNMKIPTKYIAVQMGHAKQTNGSTSKI